MPRLFTTPRTAILAVYAAFGASLGAWAGSIPTITHASDISSNGLGIGLTAFTAANVIAMSQVSRLATRLSNRTALLCVLPAVAVATMALLMGAGPFIFYASLIVWGVALGILDLFMNAEASAIEHDMRKPIFAAFHGAASTGMPVLAILSSFLSTELGTWATGLIVFVPFIFAWVLVRRAIPARHLPLRRSVGEKAVTNRMPLVMMGLAAGLIITGEVAAIMWSAKLLDEQAPELAAIAGLGAAFFGLCNAMLRYPGDSLRRLLGDIPLMLGSLMVAITGFALLGASASFALSVAAFALIGLGTAILIPCLFALAAAHMPQNRAAGIGFVALIAGVPRAISPWAFGWIATNFSTSFAFGLCTIALAAALVLIVGLRQMNDRLSPV